MLINQLVSVAVDLSKLSEAGKNDVVKKDICNAQIKNIKDEIPIFNAKNVVENKIPSITNLATTTTALTAVENKIHDHSTYTTTLEFTKLTAENFTARLKQESFATKADIADFVKQLILMIN